MPPPAHAFSSEIGIAITTHYRRENLAKLLRSIRGNTDWKTLVAVFDDGSTTHPNEETLKLCNYYLKAPSQGIAENKNRALYYFSEIRPIRRILLLEDDLIITESNWLRRWAKAIDRFGHINFTFPSWDKNEESFKGGRVTPSSPHRWTKVTGQVTGVNVAIMRQKIGYMNPMFSGFGHEHLEWTERWLSEGYGGKMRKKRIYFSLKPKGISMQHCPSTGQSYDTTRNRDIHVRLRKRGYPKIMTPWEDDQGRDRFLSAFQNDLKKA